MLNFVLLQSAGAQAGGSAAMNIIMIVVLIGVFYLFMIRPQQKRRKEIEKFRSALQRGSKVMTSGGIHGKIAAVKDSTYSIEIAPNVTITVDKNAVYPMGTSQQELQNNNEGEAGK